MTFESRLIAEIKKYECLYNLKSLNYRDLAFKDKLWQKVAQAVGASVEDCKKKWKHLRDCFNRLKKRELSQPKDRVRTKGRQKVWRYKSQMEFLTQYSCTKQNMVYEDNSDYDTSDDFGPPITTPTLNNNIAKTEEVYAEECENVEDMYTEHEKIEVDISKEFEPDIDTNSLEENMFSDLMESAVHTDPQIRALKTDEDSTTLMFKLLDRKIKQATLTEDQISDLETSVMMFVYKKLADYKN